MPDQKKRAATKAENGIILCLDGDLCRGEGRAQVM